MKKRVHRQYEKLKREKGGNLQEIADLANVSVASISRITRGKSTPSLEQVQNLASELGKEKGAKILIGYLRDMIPKGFRRAIRIQSLPENKRCLSDERLPGSLEFLNDRGRTMIERLVQLCIEDPSVLEMFALEVQLLWDPRQPDSGESSESRKRSR